MGGSKRLPLAEVHALQRREKVIIKQSLMDNLWQMNKLNCSLKLVDLIVRVCVCLIFFSTLSLFLFGTKNKVLLMHLVINHMHVPIWRMEKNFRERIETVLLK